MITDVTTWKLRRRAINLERELKYADKFLTRIAVRPDWADEVPPLTRQNWRICAGVAIVRFDFF